MKPFLRITKIINASCVILISSILLYFMISLIDFPTEIMLSENSLHSFHFKLPVEAIIEPETVSVLQVNNTPVEGNITVNLSDDLSIETADAGTAQMTINAFGIPVKKVTLDILPDIEVVPCGATIGVRIDTDGVLVLGTGPVNGEDGTVYRPSEGNLKSGDLILEANGTTLTNKESLIKSVEKSEGAISFKIRRDEQVIEAAITPVKSIEDKCYKIGVYVRDSTQGIGTVTYYNPSNHVFAALGHGILDVDTKSLMSVKTGKIWESSINTIKRGGKGAPGELVGEIKKDIALGDVKSNTRYGIYGYASEDLQKKYAGEKMKISFQDQVHEGPATIRSNIEKNVVKEYDVYIESVNRYSSDDTKGMVVRITDPELLKKTNGIVQGMSGSPIIQDGRLIGAVTHVFVQDPTKGYGIFIENMLAQERKIKNKP